MTNVMNLDMSTTIFQMSKVQCPFQWWMLNSGSIKHFSPLACTCDSEGSVDNDCHKQTGKCECEENVGGDDCSTCVPHHYAFPQCHGKIVFQYFLVSLLAWFYI